MLINKIKDLALSKARPSIMVIGDLMIDQYINGSATRISPEAPVPVVNVREESATLGGAGNVVQNLVSFGAKVTVGSAIGDDYAAGQILTMLSEEGVSSDCVLKDKLRLTTVKTRVLAGSHQLIRFDKEHVHSFPHELEDQLVAKAGDCMKEMDMVIFSDYNKGLFSPSLTQRLLAVAKSSGKKVMIDPKGDDYTKYKGAYIIKPNRHELALAAKTGPINSIESLTKAANVIFKQTGVKYLIVTLSEEGMVILSKNTYVALPVKARQVFDVTGAGDTVLATITYFLSLGFDLQDACEISNHAASIVIRRVGSATTTIQEIIDDIELSEREKLQLAN
ncbi:MAG: D-glycero-beta-D-manno-heptose-7-phosphate kinase [Mucilaginibacter sp.]|nr:D-glycero-beta-D-manno-heptose-7-phosphate kinase [Mucilaginibacter sp.]